MQSMLRGPEGRKGGGHAPALLGAAGAALLADGAVPGLPVGRAWGGLARGRQPPGLLVRQPVPGRVAHLGAGVLPPLLLLLHGVHAAAALRSELLPPRVSSTSDILHLCRPRRRRGRGNGVTRPRRGASRRPPPAPRSRSRGPDPLFPRRTSLALTRAQRREEGSALSAPRWSNHGCHQPHSETPWTPPWKPRRAAGTRRPWRSCGP